jgi:hypothetical protein
VSRWKPCKRRVFIKKLRALGFDGPYAGGSRHFLVSGQHRLAIPSNPEYSVPQLRMMPREVEVILGRVITPGDWERL